MRPGLHMPLISTYCCLIYLSPELTLHLLSQPTLSAMSRWTNAPPRFLRIRTVQMTVSFPLCKRSDNSLPHVSFTKSLPLQLRVTKPGWFMVMLGDNGIDL